MPGRHKENTARVIALAVAFFGGLATLAEMNGVFARLGPDVTVALALFALAFGALTYQLDPAVRAFVKRVLSPRANLAKPRRDPAATMW